jgi:hypothetical protein
VRRKIRRYKELKQRLGQKMWGRALVEERIIYKGERETVTHPIWPTITAE